MAQETPHQSQGNLRKKPPNGWQYWTLTDKRYLIAVIIIGLLGLSLLPLAVLFSPGFGYEQRSWVSWFLNLGPLLFATLLLLAVITLACVKASFSLWGWLGFGRGGQKTGLDLLQFLVTASIPILVAFGGIWFTEQRAQDEALQRYYEEMGRLITTGELLEAKAGDAVQTVAQARTSNVLSLLDGTRQASVVQFLYDSKLIEKSTNQECASITYINPRYGDPKAEECLPIIPLYGMDLSYADLRLTYLPDANLSGAYLADAVLNEANLRGADLRRTRLEDADLSGVTDLKGADLSGAILDGADLSGAILRDVRGVTAEELEQAADSLEGAIMPDGSVHD